MHTLDDFALEEEVIFHVSDLLYSAKGILEANFPNIWIQGELSNFSCPRSGHWYLTLKDETAQIRGAMFRGNNTRVNFTPEDGQQVLAQGKISLYTPRGDFQFIINKLFIAGKGALQQAFEALKKQLNQEGLFDTKHKQALPPYPTTIGVITSPTGAAIRDVLSVLRRRFPVANVIIYPCLVQGAKAATQICQALSKANKRAECDVLILTRGGGSLEDLWPFNEESVARAIYDSNLPIISGVGHEVDFTISDFVADLRAPTPSAAAELVSPDQQELLTSLAYTRQDLLRHMQQHIYQAQHKLSLAKSRLQHPQEKLRHIKSSLEHLQEKLNMCLQQRLLQKSAQLQSSKHRLLKLNLAAQVTQHQQQLKHQHYLLNKEIQLILTRANQKWQSLSRALQTVSPLATLDRGYAIVRRDNLLIKSVNQLALGDTLETQLSDGSISSVVERIIQSDTKGTT